MFHGNPTERCKDVSIMYTYKIRCRPLVGGRHFRRTGAISMDCTNRETEVGRGTGNERAGGGERIGYVRCDAGGASVLNESAPLAWFLVLMNLDGWGGEPPNPSKEHLAPPPLGLDHARSLLRNEARVLRLGLVSRSDFPRGEGGEGGESGAPISRGVSGGGIAALAAAAAAAAAADPVVAG